MEFPGGESVEWRVRRSQRLTRLSDRSAAIPIALALAAITCPLVCLLNSLRNSNPYRLMPRGS